jgi:hypothetical protein
MAKIIERIKQLSPFVIVATPLLFIFLFFAPWQQLESIIPLPIFLRLRESLYMTLAIGAWIFFPALFFIKTPTSRPLEWFLVRVIVLVLLIPFYCLFSYAILFRGVPEKIYNSAQYGTHNYYLTVTVDDFVTYDVYKCNEKDLGCEVVFNELGNGDLWPTALIVNKDLGVIDVYLHGSKTRSIVITPQSE